MKELLEKYKTLIIVAVVVVVGFILYTVFFTGGSGSALLTSQSSATSVTGDEELPVLLVNLKSITLDGALFNDPAFRSLVDFGQELVPEPTGRLNPFAPVGSQ